MDDGEDATLLVHGKFAIYDVAAPISVDCDGKDESFATVLFHLICLLYFKIFKACCCDSVQVCSMIIQILEC